jgi:hypothetical protein
LKKKHFDIHFALGLITLKLLETCLSGTDLLFLVKRTCRWTGTINLLETVKINSNKNILVQE